MEQVTVDGTTHDLTDPFFIIATQNPVESGGTFPLPEAQVDRFVIKTDVGSSDYDGESTCGRAARSERSPMATCSTILNTSR